jgi:prepilin-type N-terminal cleavage/methylation domain-containing protein
VLVLNHSVLQQEEIHVRSCITFKGKFKDKNLIQAGFTLVELLVVIVILGILAAVVVFAVGGITNKGKNSACQIEIRTVNTALQAYYAQNSAYPADLTAAAMLTTLQTAKFLTSATAGAGTAPTYSATTGVFSETCPA